MRGLPLLLCARRHGERLTGVGNGRERFPVASAAHLHGNLRYVPWSGYVCVCVCVLFESVRLLRRVRACVSALRVFSVCMCVCGRGGGGGEGGGGGGKG